MTLKLRKPMHKLINNGGAVLWIPQSMANINKLPVNADPYAQCSTQEVPLGSKLEWATGEVFRYCKHGETSTTPPTARMVANKNICPGASGGGTYGYEGTIDSTSNYAVGSTTLILDDTTDRVENFYEDGRLACYPSGHFCEYRIIGSEAAVSVDDVTIYIQEPGLKTALVVSSTGITAYPSIFSEVAYADSAGFETPVGVFLGPTMTDNYFSWIQRSGRAIITPTAYFGDSANERLAMYWSDGTIATAATADPSSGYMIVGYLTQRTGSEGYGDLEVWLTLE